MLSSNLPLVDFGFVLGVAASQIMWLIGSEHWNEYNNEYFNEVNTHPSLPCRLGPRWFLAANISNVVNDISKMNSLFPGYRNFSTIKKFTTDSDGWHLMSFRFKRGKTRDQTEQSKTKGKMAIFKICLIINFLITILWTYQTIINSKVYWVNTTYIKPAAEIVVGNFLPLSNTYASPYRKCNCNFLPLFIHERYDHPWLNYHMIVNLVRKQRIKIIFVAIWSKTTLLKRNKN